MKKLSLVFFAILFGIGFFMNGIPSIYAQEEFTLEEIVVTAQKREENYQKVPIQMDIISGEALLGTGKDNVDDILRDISNIIINKNDDGMRITLRGLGDDDPISGGLHTSSPSVAVNIDGAYNRESNAGQNLFDIERVEVLAGPQSTLYGSNSPGGIINVVTAAPKTDRFSTNASVEYGTYDLFDGQFVINIPVIKDLLAMRLATQMYKRDSWIEGNTNYQETKTARLKTMIEPSDTFQATVTLNYSEAAYGGRLNGMVRLFDFEDGHWDDGTPVTNPWTSADWEQSVVGSARPQPMGTDAETEGVQAEINWDTAIGSIAFVPSYSKRESSDFRSDVEITFAGDPNTYYTQQYGQNDNTQKSADLRIVSPEDLLLKWIVGGTWLDSEANNFTDDINYDTNDMSQYFSQENKAIYANITYPITDKFRGTVGYRRSWDEVKNLEFGGKKGPEGYLWGQEYSAPDYKAGIEYDLSGNSMLWATYTTSYKVDPMAAEAEQGAEAQTLDAYSVGVKNRFLDNKLQVNASAYYYDYRNKWFRGGYQSRFTQGAIIKESDFPHDGLPGTDFNYDGDYVDTNLPAGHPDLLPGESSDLVGRTIVDDYDKQFGTFESIGVDVSVDWIITRKDRLNLSVSYLDSEWKEAVVDFYWSWVWPDQGYDFSGSKAILAPEWSAHATYEHRFDLGSFGSLHPEIDIQYKSDYILSFDRQATPGVSTGGADLYTGNIEFWKYPWNYQEPHYILNGSLAFNHLSGRWSLNAYVKNATNYAAKNFYGGHFDIKLGLSDPRQYGLVLSGKY